MKLFKRILLYTAIVISILVMVVSIAGMIGAWYYNTPATETVLDIVDPAAEAVQAAGTVTDEVGTVIREVSTRVAEAQQTASDTVAEVAEADIMVEALSRIFDTDIQASVDNVRGNIMAVYDTLSLIQATIESINEIPLVNLDVPGAEAVDQVLVGMEEVAARTGEISNSIAQQRTEVIDGAVEKISEPLDQLNMVLDEAQTSLDELSVLLGRSIESLLYVQENAARWIDLGSLAITVSLVWILISQVAVFVLSRKLLAEL